MSLGNFLGDQSLGSWADEMEDVPVGGSRAGYGGESRGFGSSGGFGDRSGTFGGSSDRGGYAVREQLPFPSKPPYTAHLGNLSFDATEGDLQDFFSACSVTSVRIVEDKMERKPKGFGYVEFGSPDGLKKALELNGSQFQGRNIRISIADPPKNDRPDARELTDWSRKGPLPDLPNQRRVSERGGGGFRNYENASDAGSERGERRRPPPFEGDGKVRDFGNWERKGPLSPAAAPSGPPREGGLREGGSMRGRPGDGPRERKLSPAWGEGQSQDGSRPPRREFQERPQSDRQPTAPEVDNQWRSKMRPDAPSPSPTPDASTPSSPAAPSAPATRPRLNLAKRTVSEAEPSAPKSASSDSKASPFGAARPIDTATREKEIEEKRQLAIRQRKEQEEKAREEKRAAKEAAVKEAAANKAEKPSATNNALESGNETATGDSKPNGNENGASAPAPGKRYEILQNRHEENDSAGSLDANEDEINGSANGNIIGDKDVKPQEIVRDIPKDKAWRQDKASPTAESGPTAEGLEEDGWATVPSKPRNNRKGPSLGRALAS
ncbi:hypothetical protein B0A49_02465 [Cryomyces minteri]|uniref:RRM domain-containing protein n=2 Tax=Cryomyces TaxID=329878 RepID=A0A4U0XD86_9PEZI|nr:hypothetical protein B0A49_02465 [Cryomyces minteri]